MSENPLLPFFSLIKKKSDCLFSAHFLLKVLQSPQLSAVVVGT